jgi:uncharacterized alpha-E superfamily protein
MLLSRVAEHVYWSGRYVERAESTARVVMVHSDTRMDLPVHLGVGWEPLLLITGSVQECLSLAGGSAEEHVIPFLVTDERYLGSVVASLRQARENVRTVRPIVPREAWEVLNRLYLEARSDPDAPVSRRHRHTYLGRIVEGCQHLAGLLAGTMSHDEAYAFLRLGLAIERADMTTRVLDVRADTLRPRIREEMRPYDAVQWMSSLQSLAAYQMYRRTVNVRVQGESALRFLLQDTAFPRSIAHCLAEATTCLQRLPRPEATLQSLAEAERMIHAARVRTLAWDGLHEFVDDLQLLLGTVHDALAATYFGGDVTAEVRGPAAASA